MKLAIIPARYGSKGIPRKNVVDFCGKPMIQYTLEAALESKYIDQILVTTDDSEVLKISSNLGIINSYVRPVNLASDTAAMSDVVIHALDWFKEQNGSYPDTFILLQPTSPLRNSSDIDGAIKLFMKEQANSLISVHELSEHPYESLKLNENEWNYIDQPDKKVFRRQDYSNNFYYINGAIYILNTEFFLKNKNFLEKGISKIYEMPKIRGIDIDTILDLEIAKFLFSNPNFSIQNK
jgi:CMP-N-acetylneuraminic acid synthetase